MYHVWAMFCFCFFFKQNLKNQQRQKNKSVICPQMYFNSTLTDSSKLLKPLLVFSFIICAIICGLTRIIQYKNHAVDVYLGFLLGSAIAIYLVGAILIKCLLW